MVGSGDDAAVTRPARRHRDLGGPRGRGRPLPPRDRFAPQAIGHKALAAALSDLAAMGAAPGEAYVQLGVPADLATSECLELADGIGRGRRASTASRSLGGDIVRGAGALIWR